MVRKLVLTNTLVLFQKLTLWKEKSQELFSIIMNSHSTSITNGITDLVKEVCDLKDQLSVITKERNDLNEIVDNLSDEIRQLKTASELLPQAEETERSGQHSQVIISLGIFWIR